MHPVPCLSPSFRVPPTVHSSHLSRFRRPRGRLLPTKLHVLNIDSRDGHLQVYQEEVEAAAENIVVLNNSDFDRYFMEVTFARSKVKDLLSLVEKADQQFDELMKLHSGVLELKNLYKETQIAPTFIPPRPEFNINKRLNWAKPEVQDQEQTIIKTTKESAPKTRKSVTSETQDLFPVVTSNPLRDRKDVKLLTRQEEGVLAYQVQYSLKVDGLKEKVKEVHNRDASWDELGYLLHEDPNEVELKYHEGLQAKRVMIERNMRLVISIASSLYREGLELRDLIIDGVLGLIRAIEKFDPSKGYKLSTYAHWWIRQVIARSMQNDSLVVKLPVNVIDEHRRMRGARQSYITQHGVNPDDDTLASILGLRKKRFHTIKHAYRQVVSIESPWGWKGKKNTTENDTLEDKIKDERSLPIEEYYLQHCLKEDLDVVLSTLPKRELKVLKMRYGLDDGYQRTLENIGNEFNVSRERIRQLEAKALRKLRQRSGSLKEYAEPRVQPKLEIPVSASSLKAQ